MELLIRLDKTVVVDNVTYGPGSAVPLAVALREGAVTANQVKRLAGMSAVIDAATDDDEAPAAGKERAKIAPRKASAPNRETRERTPRHTSR